MYIKRLYIVLIISLIFISPLAYSQVTKTLNASQLKKFSEVYKKMGDVYYAIDYFEKYCEKKQKDFDAAYILADLYREARDYKKAENLYEKCYNSDTSKYVLALYYYALMLKMDEKYESALTSFQKFEQAYKNEKDEEQYLKRVKNEIIGCNFAIETKAKSSNIKKKSKATVITHLNSSINKAHIEFSPIFQDDSTMIYASYKTDSLANFLIKDMPEARPNRKFYVAQKKDNEWFSNDSIDLIFNEEGINTGNGAFSPNGDKFYFTRCQTDKNNKTICEIYVSKFYDGAWHIAEKLDKNINNPSYTSTHPTVGIYSKTNMDVLYFVSDRPGGEGGMDIWYSLFDENKGEYKEPSNAGNKINTIGNELTPFYDVSSKTMCFSSDGWPGLGGYDIFKTTGELTNWLKPENVKIPINSSVDDIYFSINKNNKAEGFYTSNRKGGVALKNPTCCFDIYSYLLPNYIVLAIKGVIFEIPPYKVGEYLENIKNNDFVKNTYLFTMQEINNNLLEDAIVTISVVDQETGQKILINTDTTDKMGNYFFPLEFDKFYELEAKKEGFFSNQFNVSTKLARHSDTVQMQPRGLYKIPKLETIIKNIYYPFDEFYLTDDAKHIIDNTLLAIMQENPELILEIRSHTDSKGTDEYNIKLSDNRAKSVVDYLKDNGINKNRLQSKGFGETMPIAPNTNPDGSDNPDGRQKNRRTEFRVIGIIKGTKIIYLE